AGDPLTVDERASCGCDRHACLPECGALCGQLYCSPGGWLCEHARMNGTGAGVVAIDQGSSSTRCVVSDAELHPVASASAEVRTVRRGPGIVEHDPREVFDGLLSALREVVDAAGSPDVAAVGIATQTETFVMWDAGSGEPVTPLISWQDQ